MGKQQRFSLTFDFDANIGPIKSQVETLQKSLAGVTLPPSLASNFEKIFGKLNSEMSEFEAMTKNGFANMADVNKAQTSFSKISKLLNQLGAEAGRIKGIDPNKLLPKDAQNKIEGLRKKLGELQTQQKKENNYIKQIEKQNELINKQKKALQDLETARKALEADSKSLGGQKGTLLLWCM